MGEALPELHQDYQNTQSLSGCHVLTERSACCDVAHKETLYLSTMSQALPASGYVGTPSNSTCVAPFTIGPACLHEPLRTSVHTLPCSRLVQCSSWISMTSMVLWLLSSHQLSISQRVWGSQHSAHCMLGISLNPGCA